MTGIRARFALFVATAAIAPLLVYGVVSVRSLRTATEQSVVGRQSRGGAARWPRGSATTSRTTAGSSRPIGSQMQDMQLAEWQQQRLLKNHVMDFDELRQISVIDARRPAALLEPRVAARRSPGRSTSRRRFAVAPPDVDADQLPTTRVAIPFDGEPLRGGWIVAEISLEQLWREVDQIRIGSPRLTPMLIDGEGRFIAHGDPTSAPSRPIGPSRPKMSVSSRALSEAAIREQLPSGQNRLRHDGRRRRRRSATPTGRSSSNSRRTKRSRSRIVSSGSSISRSASRCSRRSRPAPGGGDPSSGGSSR